MDQSNSVITAFCSLIVLLLVVALVAYVIVGQSAQIITW
jgi:hypothetical protein